MDKGYLTGAWKGNAWMERDNAIGMTFMDLGFPNHVLSEQAERAIAETIVVA